MNNSNPNIYVKLNEVMEREKCMPRKLQVLNSISDKEISAAGQLSSKGYVKMFAAGLGSTSYQNVKKVNLNQNNLCNEELKIVIVLNRIYSQFSKCLNQCKVQNLNQIELVNMEFNL